MDAAARANQDLEATDTTATVVDLSRATVSIAGPSQVSTRLSTDYERFVKPVVDIVGAALLLVVTAPLTIAAAVAIWVTMGGPVILRQQRVGEQGRVFTLYKFRTMEPDRRNNPVPFVGDDRRQTHKHPEDPRITPVGQFLRVWSIDELPQFLNVLKRDMSLVGPRPEMVDIVAQYQPWQHGRHAVKPGITGSWQISERGDKMLHECTESDIDYVESLSVWSDLRILALTPLAVLGLRRGI